MITLDDLYACGFRPGEMPSLLEYNRLYTWSTANCDDHSRLVIMVPETSPLGQQSSRYAHTSLPRGLRPSNREELQAFLSYYDLLQARIPSATTPSE